MFLVCFAVDNRDSFDNVRNKWVPEIRHYSPHTPIMVVGTKADLRNDEHTEEEESGVAKLSFVTSLQGAALADEVGAVK